MMSSYAESDTNHRAIAGSLQSLPGGGLLTIWKINTQGKDGQARHHIVRIGMNMEGDTMALT